MIKLLKYDWKRNSTLLIAAAVVLVLAQVLFTTIGNRQDWSSHAIYAGNIAMYILASGAVFLVVCTTFYRNSRAYSRKLLPVPAVAHALAPLLSMFICQLVLGVLFAAYDRIAYFASGEETIAGMLLGEISFAQLLDIMFAFVWLTVVLVLVVQFGIVFAGTFEGRAGTWLGIAASIVLFVGVPWLSDMLFPLPDDVYPETADHIMRLLGMGVEMTADGAEAVYTYQSIHFASLLFEAVIIAAVFYGIVYMLRNKVKV